MSTTQDPAPVEDLPARDPGLPEAVEIYDTTLRDGAQLEGISLTVDDKLRVTLKHQSEAEVAEIERLLKEELEKKSKTTEKPAMKLAVLLPASAKDIETAKNRIEFKLETGKAKGAVEELRKKFREDGWKESEAVLVDVAGTVVFSKNEGPTVTIVYVDPGLIPAEITISGSRIELETATPEKE